MEDQLEKLRKAGEDAGDAGEAGETLGKLKDDAAKLLLDTADIMQTLDGKLARHTQASISV